MTTRVETFAPMDYVRALEMTPGLETPWVPDRLEHGRLYATGPSYTIRIDGQIAAVLGLLIPWPRARVVKATAWAYWTPVGYRHPGTVHRLTVRYLRELIAHYRVVRLEAEVDDRFTGGHLWLAHLGLEPEGPARRYAGPQGETMQSYVWLHPDAARMAPRPARGPLPAARRADGSVIPAIAGAYDGGATLYIAIALAVAAGAASAYATYQAGEAQKAGHEYQAKVAENQAQSARAQAEWAARQQRAHDRKVMAAARAAQGVSGVEGGEGSSLLIDIENARQSALNAEAARYQTEARERGLRGQAGLERWQGRMASTQGQVGAGATLLATGARAAGMAYNPTPQTIRVQPAGGYSVPPSGSDSAFDY